MITSSYFDLAHILCVRMFTLLFFLLFFFIMLAVYGRNKNAYMFLTSLIPSIDRLYIDHFIVWNTDVYQAINMLTIETSVFVFQSCEEMV